MKRRNWIRRIVWGLIAVLGLWIGSDFAYSTITMRRLLEWEKGVARDRDGVRIGCRERTIGSGETAILFIHGFGDSPAVFSRMAPALAARGYTCRLMRLPGFAEPVENLKNADKDAWNAAVASELSALRRSHDRVIVVAHSLGGALAIEHLLDHPRDADGVVLIAPLVKVARDRSPLLSARAWYEVGENLFLFTDVVESPFPRDTIVSEQEAPDFRTPFVPRGVYRSMFAVLDDIDGRAAEFRTPLLMVVSQRDRVVDTAAAERFFEEAPAARKEILRTAEAGHVIPLDRGWRDVTERIDAFIRGVSDGGGSSPASS